jgi:hypothetical protein
MLSLAMAAEFAKRLDIAVCCHFPVSSGQKA